MAMSDIKRKLLLQELARLGFNKAEYLPSTDTIKAEPTDHSPIIYGTSGFTHWYGNDDPMLNKLKTVVREIEECADVWDRSKDMPLDDLSRFRVLAEYKNIMLAARDDTGIGHGLHFVTWEYNDQRTAVNFGHYTTDYNAAKQDFAVRSGLMPAEKVISLEQAAEIKASIEYRIINDEDLTFKTEETLRAIDAQLSEAYPSVEVETSAPAVDGNTETRVEPETAEPAYEMTRYESLHEKMSAELDSFREGLKELPPEKIMDRAYELAMKEELLNCIDSENFNAEVEESLLGIDYPLDYLYQEWIHSDASYMDILADGIKDSASVLLDEAREQETEQSAKGMSQQDFERNMSGENHKQAVEAFENGTYEMPVDKPASEVSEQPAETITPPTEKQKAPEQSADTRKPGTLAAKMAAANEKVKAQDARNNGAKTHKRGERE